MRLYSRTGAASVTHEGVHYKPGPEGGFDFPAEVSDVLHPFAVGGQKMWETDIERQHRLAAEELARVRDPATLYEAVAKIVAAAEAAPAQSGPAKADTGKAAPAAKASASK